MRITSLSLTNFRSFRSTQTIDFAPVTLLFGPNSVGKSSVLMALFYIQQILDKGHCDPVRLDALGDKHIGGFKRLVNGRDLNKKIVLKLVCDKKGSIGATYKQVSEVLEADLGLTVDSPTADADKVEVELHIGWSKSRDTAYIACYKVWLDGVLTAELTSDSGLKQPVISYLNYRHPALQCEQDVGYQGVSDTADFISGLQEHINAPRLTDEVLSSSSQNEDLIHLPISFKGMAGALPLLGETLNTSLDIDNAAVNIRIHEILSDVVVAPLDNLLELLNDSLCIGPLRMVPDARYQTNPYPEQKDWYTGAAAWDVLGRSPSQIAEVNHWLKSSQGLDLGYSVRNKVIASKVSYLGGDNVYDQLKALQEQFGESLQFTISKEDKAENPDASEVKVNIDELMALSESSEPNAELSRNNHFDESENKAVLWDEVNNIEVASSEIGVGVSQLLPLVVASVCRNKGIIACEQPELHVHPRVQVGVGDLLTQNTRQTSFLIETHSEHLILRILKRIRQTSENELPEGLNNVSPEDISIVYLEPTSYGVKAKRIEIDEDGEFRQRWPRGFFGERREELM